jgi:hypothetical protein
MLRCRALLVPLAFLASLAATAAPRETPPAKEASAEIHPVPAAEIPYRADADERYARAVAERARDSDLAARLGPRLDVIDRATRDLASSGESADLSHLPAMRRDSLSRHWAFHARQLARWQADRQQVASGFSAKAGDLARRRATWEATIAVARQFEVAPALDRRVETVLAQLAGAERSLAAPLEVDARLASRAAAVETRIVEAQASVATTIRQADERLLRIDSPPLRRLGEQARRSHEAAGAARRGLALELDFLRAWATASAARLAAHGVGVLVLLPLLFWLRRQNAELLEKDADLRSSSALILRPVSSWLVLSLMSVLVIEPDAPILVHEVAFLLALVPVLRILPQRVFTTLGPWPYAATALYLLHHLGFLFAGHPVNHRLYLLGLTLLTLATLTWLLLARRGLAPAGRLPALLRTAGWAAVAGLAASAGVNAFGNVTLASVITGGVLDSGSAGLALFAGVSVVGALVRLSIARSTPAGDGMLQQHSQPPLRFTARASALAALAL